MLSGMKKLIAPLLAGILIYGCGGGSATQSPSAAPTPSPTGTAEASATPAVTPTPSVTFACTLPVTLTGTTGAVETAVISDVRVGSHPDLGYDRIVFEFSGATYPGLTVSAVNPPFAHDASGIPFTVEGSSFLELRLTPATISGGYVGSTDIGAPSSTSNVRQFVQQGDFEAIDSWIVGLSGSTCVNVSTLTGPTRIVVDIQE
jgi:hypothetical protein